MPEFKAKDSLNKKSFKDTIQEKLDEYGISVWIDYLTFNY